MEVAKKMGADHTLLVGSGDAQSLAQQVCQIMGGMPDITFECSGAQAGLILGFYVRIPNSKIYFLHTSKLLYKTHV